jgi:hypothetical protein
MCRFGEQVIDVGAGDGVGAAVREALLVLGKARDPSVASADISDGDVLAYVKEFAKKHSGPE